MLSKFLPVSMQYALFKPSGEPLRTKITLGFERFLSRSESVCLSLRVLPDLSHSVEVGAGDTLPLLFNRIYGDRRYQVAVVWFDKLADFCRLTPSQSLHFPTLA